MIKYSFYERGVSLEKEKLLHKVVAENRGGFCYELNGAFYELLSSIGFEVRYLSAGVYSKEGVCSPEYDHMALMVNFDGKEFLADVGFGDSFIEPLKFVTGEIQKDVREHFLISESENKGYFNLKRSTDGVEFNPQYKFSSAGRKLNEFSLMCEYNQISPASHFTQQVICSKATASGRISLIDLKLIETRNGIKKQWDISEAEFYSLLKTDFNIELSDKLIFPQNKSYPTN